MTDANVVLGLLDPDEFLGGGMRLYAGAARAAVARVAARAGHRSSGRPRKAWPRVVNTNMAEGIRIVSVRRGVDPRRFTLIAFGGAAGLHVTELARLLEIRRVVVPTVAAVLSAWGMLATDLRYELVRSHVSEVLADDAGRPRQDLRHHGGGGASAAGQLLGPHSRAPLARHAVRRADLRDRGEHRRRGSAPAADAIDQIAARFHTRHEALYAYSAPGQEVVVVNARVAVIGALPDPARGTVVSRRHRIGHTRTAAGCISGRWVEVPVYRLDGLAPGLAAEGPGHLRVADHDGAGARGRARERHAPRLARHRARLETHRDSRSATARTVQIVRSFVGMTAIDNGAGHPAPSGAVDEVAGVSTSGAFRPPVQPDSERERRAINAACYRA